MYLYLFVFGFRTLSVTSTDQCISICGSPQWLQAPLVGYVPGPRLGMKAFRTFDLFCSPAPVSLIDTATVDGTKV